MKTVEQICCHVCGPLDCNLNALNIKFRFDIVIVIDVNTIL